MSRLIFVDCEATGPCPGMGVLTEFGAVDYETRQSFHGLLYYSEPDPENPAKSRLTKGEELPIIDQKLVYEKFEQWLHDLGPGRYIFVSDNPAYDFQWINYGFWHTLGRTPFGHSGRRIGDFWAGARGNWAETQGWKKFRVTPHDHNPVNDAMGNVEAFATIMERYGKESH